MDNRRERISLGLGFGLLILGFMLAALLMGCPPPTPPPNPPDPPAPPDPPVETPTVAVYVGVYDLLGATGDVDAFLGACKANGAKGIRLFCLFSWQGPQPISPYKQVGTWTHDNGITFPLYRLSEWNLAYWDYLADVLEACAGHGLTAWLVAEDYCSLKGDQRVKYFNPMMSSEEALGPSTPGGVWGEAQKPFHAALYRKIIQTAEATPGLGWLIEDMNEGWIVDGTSDQVRDWFAWSRNALVAVGAPAGRIVTTVDHADVAQAADIYSPHGIGRPDQIVPFGQMTNKIIYSSDGFWQGQGPADCKGKRGPGLDVANAIGLKIIQLGARGYEYLPRDAYKNDCNRACVDGLDLSVVKAIAFAK